MSLHVAITAPDTSIAKLVCAAVVGPLLAILNSKDTELVETSLKALRNIVARAQAHKIGVIQVHSPPL